MSNYNLQLGMIGTKFTFMTNVASRGPGAGGEVGAGKNKTPSGLICPRLPAAAVAGVVVVVAAARLPDLAGDGDPVEAGLVPLLAAVEPLLVRVGGVGELAALGHLTVDAGAEGAQDLDLVEAGVAGAVRVGGSRVFGKSVRKVTPGDVWAVLGGEPVAPREPGLPHVRHLLALLQARDTVPAVEAGALGVAGPLLARLGGGGARPAVGHRARR